MLIETEEQAALGISKAPTRMLMEIPLAIIKLNIETSGKSIVLKLKTASSVAGGILDQYDLARII